MKLQEKHKIFVIRSYARFMKLPEIIDVFIDEFADNIEELCDTPYITEADYIEQSLAEAKKEGSDEDYDNLIAHAEDIYSHEVEDDNDSIHRKLGARFRRLNITHQQFPQKYRDIFTQLRKEYYQELRTKSLDNPYNTIEELEKLYLKSKKSIIDEDNLKQIPIAHQLLKSIISARNVLRQIETTEKR